MKKKIFLLFLPVISLTVMNVVSCQIKTTYSIENIDLLNEMEDELKNYNWKTPLYNEENNNLERMINDLEATKIKINIAEKLEYNEKSEFYNESNKLKKQIETLKINIIPGLKKINSENINAIFDWINNKIAKHINTIKTTIMSTENKDFLLEKLSKVEIISKFFSNFPRKAILLLVDQSQNQNASENCNTIDCDILNFSNAVLHHFYIIEQMKIANETEEEIATKKIENLHKLWIKLWETNLTTIYENLKNPNVDFIE